MVTTKRQRRSPTAPKDERNARLIAAWRSGRYKSIKSLAKQFRVTRQCASFIIHRAARRGELELKS